MLCTIALLGLKPWEPDESVPRLAPPGVATGVGDSVALPTVAPAVAVAKSAVTLGRAVRINRPGVRPGEGEGRESAPAVGPALAVAVPAGGETAPAPGAVPLPASPPPEAPPAAAPPAPELASVPSPPPGAAPEAKTPGGPVSAGTPGAPGGAEEEPGEPEEACEGDEYVLTVTPLEGDGEAVAIVLEHVAADGSVETLELEGDVEDARSLVFELSAEGGCVEVEFVPPAPVEAVPPTPTP
ncbi:MAG TPA: hypothetical protein VG898_10860 [Solirubrobacterales bacterium]|nr:hypothetical protein [Solirubrobacterales bacterium]